MLSIEITFAYVNKKQAYKEVFTVRKLLQSSRKVCLKILLWISALMIVPTIPLSSSLKKVDIKFKVSRSL